MNTLNLKIIKKNFLSDSAMVLDYDNTLIYTHKSDAKITYRMAHGYAPSVAFIDGKVVYVENRNGNSDAQTLQQETLARMFDLLKSQGIKPKVFRADAGSYQLSTLSVVSQNVDKLFIKARMSQGLQRAITK